MDDGVDFRVFSSSSSFLALLVGRIRRLRHTALPVLVVLVIELSVGVDGPRLATIKAGKAHQGEELVCVEI